MAKKNPAAVLLGKKGGKAAAESMTPEERSARARKGALARAKKYAKKKIAPKH